jgi:hypothetical protein
VRCSITLTLARWRFGSRLSADFGDRDPDFAAKSDLPTRTLARSTTARVRRSSRSTLSSRSLDELREDAGMSKAELARRGGRNPASIRACSLPSRHAQRSEDVEMILVGLPQESDQVLEPVNVQKITVS